MKLLRAALLTLVAVMMMVTMTGCETTSEVSLAIEQALSVRKAMEMEQLESLHKNGFISDDSYKSLLNAINALKVESMSSEAAVEPYVRLSNATAIPGGGSSYVDFTGGHEDEINDELQFTIYALKPDIAASKSLAQIQELMKKFQEDKEKYRADVDLLFESTGKPLSSGNIFINSSSNTNPDINALGKDVAVRNPYYGMTDSEDSLIADILAAAGLADATVPYIVTVQVRDFNPTVITALTNGTSIDGARYIADRDTQAAYLIEYPVQYVNQYTINTTNNVYMAGYAKTPYQYNILTGEVRFGEKAILGPNVDVNSYSMNFGQADPLYTADSFMLVNRPVDHEIKTLKRANSNGGELTTVQLEQITVPSIVLTDYLEYTLLPEFSSDTDLVALGRVLRLNDKGVTSGGLAEVVGTYVSTIDHKTLLNSSSLEQNFGTIGLKDIVQIVPASDGSYIKLAVGGMATSTPAATDPTTGDVVVGDTSSDSVKYSYADQIWPAVQFTDTYYKLGQTTTGGKILVGSFTSVNTINKSDTTEKSGESVAPPLIYGMATSKGIFDSSLFSGWIMTEYGEHGSLKQWNTWLGNAGFKYSIDSSALETYLNGNYSNELRDNGIIILDLGVIANIQGDYNRQDTVNRVTGFRTAFVILGMVLISYGVLLLCSWAFDINIVGGPKLLTALTFGNWIAVSSVDELPNMAVGERHYMTFSKTLKSVIVIIAAGCLLYMVDVVGLVSGLVSLIGKIAELISTSVFGN